MIERAYGEPPETSPEFEALAALAEAYLATHPTEEALLFLRALAEGLRRETNVVDFRSGRADNATKSRSAAWLAAKLHVWLLTYGEPMVTPSPIRRAPRPRARAPRLDSVKPR